MKIKHLGFSAFKITGNSDSVITDPIAAVNAGVKLEKTEADIALFSQKDLLGKTNVLKEAGLDNKVVPQNRSEVFEIVNYGEFAIGGLMIRRFLKSGIYLIDEGYLRLAYIGLVGPEFEIDWAKNLGDVDVLIMPIGDGGIFPAIDKVEKIISIIDPSYLIPYGFNEAGLKPEFAGLKKLEDFLKEGSFANTIQDKELKLTNVPEKDDKVMQVMLLNN